MNEDEVVLSLRREEESIDVKIKPVECEPDEYKLGIWVRDNVQGLGTITFLTGSSEFGALGHGIHDSDTNVLYPLRMEHFTKPVSTRSKRGRMEFQAAWRGS